jgi:hypothetical protein
MVNLSLLEQSPFCYAPFKTTAKSEPNLFSEFDYHTTF